MSASLSARLSQRHRQQLLDVVHHRLPACPYRLKPRQAQQVESSRPQLPVALTSTIQLVPIQASLMCSGASLARSVQVMSRPWLIS